MYSWKITLSRSCSHINSYRRILCIVMMPLQWHHNERDGISNHQPRDCLFNRLFRRRSQKTSKLRVTGRCAGKSPVAGEFPTQRASNAENVSFWWCHHAIEPFQRFGHWTTWNHFTLWSTDGKVATFVQYMLVMWEMSCFIPTAIFT